MYGGVLKIFSRYWKAYGGLSSLLKSFYLHASIIAASILCNQPVAGWEDVSLRVLPILFVASLLCLLHFVVFVGLKETAFTSLILKHYEADQKRGLPSIYESLTASLVHFALIQTAGILVAVLAKLHSGENLMISFLGVVLLCYSVMLSIAGIMHIFRFATMRIDSIN